MVLVLREIYYECLFHLRGWLLITRRGGLQNEKIAGPKLCPNPPPRDKSKTIHAPLFNRVETFCVLLQHGLNLKSPALPQTCAPTPFHHGCSLLFCRGKTWLDLLPPTTVSLAPTPVPVINDQSLMTCIRDSIKKKNVKKTSPAWMF